MTPIDPSRVRELFRQGDEATTNAGRGRALEDLIVYVFSLIPGLGLVARNSLNAFAAEEIDVAFWNDCLQDGLAQFDHLLLVECKNWSTPVGYPELAVFSDKLRSRGRPMGVLIATYGITGNPEQQTAAHSVLARELAAGRELIVVTREELESLSDTRQLIQLLKRKRAQLAVSGTIHSVR